MKQDKKNLDADNIQIWSPEVLREYLWTMNFIGPLEEIFYTNQLKEKSDSYLFPFMGWVLAGGGLPSLMHGAFSFLGIIPKTNPTPENLIKVADLDEWASRIYGKKQNTASYYFEKPNVKVKDKA